MLANNMPGRACRQLCMGMPVVQRDYNGIKALEDGNVDSVLGGQISFVDLAGSERIRDARPDSQLRETSSINRSLFTLGKVATPLHS